jgi:hypothetical protein
MTVGKLRDFVQSNLSVGDRLAEAFYAIWMVVVTIGLLNSEVRITPELIATVVLIAFGVNLVWGIIDGVTVMYGNIIARSQWERTLYDLRAKGDGAEEAALRRLADEPILAALDGRQRRAVIDMLAEGERGPDPRTRPQRATREDWEYALSVVLLDVAVVIPLVLPLVLLRDPEWGVYVSRIVATAMFAILGMAYAANLNRNRWVAGIGLGALGFAVFTLAYMFGW